jgi:hypothetical protein
MFVARWQFTSRFGKLEQTLSILRKWEIDVGQRIGWKSIRVVTGLVGGSDTDIELETRIDNVADLEAAWGDMQRNPHHAEYMKSLETLIVDGSNRWTIHREVSLLSDGD